MVEVGAGTEAESSEMADVRAMAELVADLAVAVKNAAPGVAIPMSQKVQQVFGAIELEKTAELRRAGASDRDVRRRAAAGGTRSKRSASRAARRAEAVGANPDLADEVADGAMGEEQLDAIAVASEKTDGEAACDRELVDEVKNASPDEAAKITSRWLERRDDENSAKSRYDRQRERRLVRFAFDAKTGCETLFAQGDRETIDELKRVVKARADELYQADGGRDVPAAKHRRTHGQRMFDALRDVVAGGPAAGSAGEGAVRSMLHVGLVVDDAAADEIRAATIGGAGYLPPKVLERYGCSSMVAGTVFDERGEVLWHGRSKRHATPAQWSALIARDKGCVLCGAEPSRCQAHHVMPWTAPGKGKTDIDEMALVCTDDHHWLHDEQLTLFWQLGPPDPETGIRRRVWKTRPATPNEIAQSHRAA